MSKTKIINEITRLSHDDRREIMRLPFELEQSFEKIKHPVPPKK